MMVAYNECVEAIENLKNGRKISKKKIGQPHTLTSILRYQMVH